MSLLIQHSTRILPLAPATNDIAMPYGRLLALISPGRDGWPGNIDLTGENLFHGYPNYAYFWDTVSYVGLLPLFAMLLLLVLRFTSKRSMSAPFAFLTVLGIGALLLSLPLAQPLYRLIPGTFLRSPSRLLYLCTFSASVALGCAVNWFMASDWFSLRLGQIILVACLVGHVADLGAFTRLFVQPEVAEEFPRPFAEVLDRDLDGSRIASEDMAHHGRYHDAGIFDSILLANPYRAMLGLAGLPPGINEQAINAATFPLPALQAAGVRFVITFETRRDLELVYSTEQENLYRAPDPFPRTAFFGGPQIDFAIGNTILDRFIAEPRRDKLLLPVEAERTYTPEAHPDLAESKVNAVPAIYSRPSSDEIHIQTAPDRSGFVGVLESYDPGWSATVDGAARPVVLANGFTMAVPVTPGKHLLILRYSTPGRRLGILLSLGSAVLLACLLGIAAKNENPA